MHSSPPPSYPSAPRTAWLQKAAAAVDALNDGIGRVLAWSLLLMTLAMLVVIFCASVLNTGWIWLSEIIVYLHALLFMGAAAYSLRHGRHVRIDIFYNRYCPRRQHWLNLLGVLFLLLPMCVVIIVYSYPYVTASWAVHETSPEGEGLPAVFLLKTVLLVMPLLLSLQGLGIATRCALALCVGASVQDQAERKD